VLQLHKTKKHHLTTTLAINKIWCKPQHSAMPLIILTLVSNKLGTCKKNVPKTLLLHIADGVHKPLFICIPSFHLFSWVIIPHIQLDSSNSNFCFPHLQMQSRM
jgi:hypothetical protein